MDTTQWPTAHDEGPAGDTDASSTVDESGGEVDHHRAALFRWGHVR